MRMPSVLNSSSIARCRCALAGNEPPTIGLPPVPAPGKLIRMMAGLSLACARADRQQVDERNRAHGGGEVSSLHGCPSRSEAVLELQLQPLRRARPVGADGSAQRMPSESALVRQYGVAHQGTSE